MSHLFRRSLFLMVLLLAVAAGARLSQAQTKDAAPDEPQAVAVQGTVDLSPAQRSADAPSTIILNESFEGIWPAGGWSVADFSDADGGEYLWEDSYCWPHSGSWGAYSVGGGAAGSQLPCWGGYPNNADTWTFWGPFSLVGASAASFTYYFHGITENSTNCVYDKFIAAHVDDDGAYSGQAYCGDWAAGPDGSDYYARTIDLASRLGDSTVWLGFALRSDGSIGSPGFMIDDVRLDITTSCAAPAAPTLIGPADGTMTTDTTPTLSWNAVANAGQYRLQVDNNADFSSPVVNQLRTTTDFTPGAALARQGYFWRVISVNNSGGCNQPGGSSLIWAFTISNVGASGAFLPSIHRAVTTFAGPRELEPNNSEFEANGPIALNTNYQGYVNDLSDFYFFDLTTTRQLNISLTGMSGKDPQLHLYRDSRANRVGYDATAPYTISYNAPPGRYWVRAVAVGNYNTTALYTLRVSAP